MRRNASPARLLLTLLLLAGLFFGAAGGAMARVEGESNPVSIPPQTEEPAQKENSVNPAPLRAKDELNIVISEFRFNGPEGASDEFIELFNPGSEAITIFKDWLIKGANNSGDAGSNRYKFPANVTLQPGQHYLLVFKDASASLLTLADATYSTGTTDDGGIALTLPNGVTIIDQVGLSAGTVYKEGTPLAPLTGTANQSYERKNAGNIYNCVDTDNNAADFTRNASSINPQNSTSAYTPCLVVTDVRSTDGTYVPGQALDIKITFSSNVNVTGTPKLFLETGLVDTPAIYTSGSGSPELIFRYTVAVGDSSLDLDYVTANSLTLDGGSITGAIGGATLILPKPGTGSGTPPLSIGSLGYNNNIKIDNGSQPTVLSIKRQNPLSATTDADSLTFRVSFSEAVTNVDAADFAVNSTPAIALAPTVSITPINQTSYDVTVSNGGLTTFNGTIGLDLNSPTITDLFGNDLLPQEPPVDSDETYTVNNTFTVTVERATGQLDTDDTAPVNFTVEFSQPINVSTFTVSDITQNGTATFITWSITDSGNHKIFSLSATAIGGNGTVIPSIASGKVNNTAGLGNQASTTVNGNVVTFLDAVRPSVTVDKATGQADPTGALPILFTVVFSEPINASTFSTSDITQNGTATGITWSINNSGDNKKFTLSATSAGFGTLKPSIAANRVLDLLGNNNLASTSMIDDEVIYRRPLTVTVNQSAKQRDPTVELPIEFDVVFSREIDPNTFTVEDIIQTGTAAGVTWRITNPSNDDKTFILTGRNTDSYGTLIPIILAEKVMSVDGIGNLASTSTDGSVNYIQEGAPKTVVITEVAWMGTTASSSDEWIELFNTTNETIHLDGWVLRSFRYNGEDFYINLNIQLQGDIQPRTVDEPGSTSGYFLLETRENAVSSIPADQIYSGSLYNSGEILVLCSPYNLLPGSPAPCNINVKNKLVDFVNGSLTTSGNIKPWPAGSSSIYGSMERRNLLSDDETNYYTHTGLSPKFGLDANGNGIKGTPKHPNWANTVIATPRATFTPTRTPTPRPAAAPILVLNEVLARAGSDWNNDGVVDVYDEFIEVMNAGTVNVTLSNYKLDDEKDIGSAPFTLPGVTLKPGEKTVFYGSQTGILLDDSGDTVRLLRTSNSSVVDAVTYTMVKSLDFSVCRYTDGYGSWIVGCYPTPGRPNELTGDRFPSTSNGQPIPVCVLPDSVPAEFVLAECEESGLGIWNPSYWDGSPGEGNEIWQPDERDKWLVIYQ